MEVLRQNGSVHQKMMKYFKSNYCLVDIRLKETLKRITLKQVITNTHSHPPKTYLYPPIHPWKMSSHPHPPKMYLYPPQPTQKKSPLTQNTSPPTHIEANLVPSASFCSWGRWKEALEHFKHVIDICLNRGHIFQKKLRNTLTVILKISACVRAQFLLACRVKDKNVLWWAIIISLWLSCKAWASSGCESKMEKQDLQAGESWWQNCNSTIS